MMSQTPISEPTANSRLAQSSVWPQRAWAPRCRPSRFSAQLAPDLGGPDDEIRIGNIMPYTGPLAAFATIGRAEGAYFDMVNARGGINGRKIKFFS